MKGKVTIVTGASQGIGRAIAEFLAEKGSDIAVFDVADGADAVRAIEARGVKGRIFSCRCVRLAAGGEGGPRRGGRDGQGSTTW